MSGLLHDEREVSRRRFLAMGGALAAAGTFGGLVDPLARAAARRAGRRGGSSARDAVRVKESQFMPVAQFRRWNKALDRIGPPTRKGCARRAAPRTRATSTTPRGPAARRRRAAPLRVGADAALDDGRVVARRARRPAAGPVKTASYIPYSGQTPPQGVTGQLALVEPGSTPAPGSLAGRIAVFDVPLRSSARLLHRRSATRAATTTRAASSTRPAIQAAVPQRGRPAARRARGRGRGRCGRRPRLPRRRRRRLVLPLRRRSSMAFPGLYVDRAVGAALKDRARAGHAARLTLPAHGRAGQTAAT